MEAACHCGPAIGTGLYEEPVRSDSCQRERCILYRDPLHDAGRTSFSCNFCFFRCVGRALKVVRGHIRLFLTGSVNEAAGSEPQRLRIRSTLSDETCKTFVSTDAGPKHLQEPPSGQASILVSRFSDKLRSRKICLLLISTAPLSLRAVREVLLRG